MNGFGSLYNHRILIIAAAAILTIAVPVILVTWLREIKNSRYPRLTVPATVLAKRTYVRYDDGESSTRYYATFQFESGDRLELRIPRKQIGYLIEGDRGQLTYQGKRFLDFDRT